MRINKRAAVVVTGAIAALAIAGTAFAFWTAPGSGKADASTSDTKPLIITQTSELKPLAPGVAPQPLEGTLDNPNDATVHVNSLTVKVDTNSKTCGAENFTVVSPISVSTDVVGNGTGNWSGGSIAFNNTDKNQDACKNVKVQLVYSSN